MRELYCSYVFQSSCGHHHVEQNENTCIQISFGKRGSIRLRAMWNVDNNTCKNIWDDMNEVRSKARLRHTQCTLISLRERGNIQWNYCKKYDERQSGLSLEIRYKI